MRSVLERLRRGMPGGFFRNVAWQSSASLWAGASTFFYGLLVGKYLGAGEYGLIAMATAFAQVFSQALELRLQEAVIKYVSDFWEAGQRAKAFAAIKLSLLVNCCSTGLATVLILAAVPLAQDALRKDPRCMTIIGLAALTVLSTNFALATCQSVLRVLGEYRAQAFITIVSNAVKLFATLAVILWMHAGIIGVMSLGLAVSLVTTLVTGIVTYLRLKQNLEPEDFQTSVFVLRPLFREMIGFVRSTYFLSLSMIPTRDLDVNLLGYFVSKESVGVYRMAKNFMAAVWTLSDAAFLVIYPELARLWARGEQSVLWGFVKRVAVIMGAFGLLLYLGGCVGVPIVTHYVLGPSFDGTGRLFALMAWGLLFWAPMIWANPLLMAAGRPDLVLRSSVINSLVCLCLSLYTIPVWGTAGSAFTFSVANPIIAVLVLIYGWIYGIFRFRGTPSAVPA